MNPLEERIKVLEDRFNRLEKSSLYTFEKPIQMLDGRNVQVGTRTGTMLATAATQKLGFFGRVPVTQRLKASYNNWTSLSDITQALVDLGLFDQI